jgi:glutamine amidotransferase
METIGVIDYGMGNLHSLAKSLERVAGNQRIVISYDPAELLECDRLVLPGVGGARACMDELRRLELDQMVIEAARKRPLLGVCLGMQVLLERSDENGGVNCLGLIPGSVVRFPDPAPEQEPAQEGVPAAERLKVPHMGWNQVRQARPHPVWEGLPEDPWFYFVHSYHAAPPNPGHVLGLTDYGQPFAAAVARDNIVGFQFHPEKSHDMGLRLLANFVNWNGENA